MSELNPLQRSIVMPKRERVELRRIEGDRNRAQVKSDITLWYDAGQLERSNDLITRLAHTAYTGVIVSAENAEAILPTIGSLTGIISFETPESFDEFQEGAAGFRIDGDSARRIVASPSEVVLRRAREMGIATCYRAFVDDGESLHRSIEVGSQYDFLMVSFRDPTNIPLELVIASLQATRTVLIKEIKKGETDDALVTLGVMEVGADGVAYSPAEHGELDRFLARLTEKQTPTVKIEVGTVVRTAPVGMGYRSCIDLATLFAPTEGMIVGSTSQGGILCCPEVFFLPYMELRPFRVNAGAVHSYVYNLGNRTDYMTELKAGSSVMIADLEGKVRRAPVGRMKTEIRPLRLIEAEFSRGERVNVLMQDDWHVRIFSAEGKPLNITELKPGDKILGHIGEPGRHVGIKVDEHIVEN